LPCRTGWNKKTGQLIYFLINLSAGIEYQLNQSNGGFFMKKIFPILAIICALVTLFGCKKTMKDCLKECDKAYDTCKEKETVTGTCGELHNKCYSRCNIEDLMKK